MITCLDIGNSRIKRVLFDSDGLIMERSIFPSLKGGTDDEIAAQIEKLSCGADMLAVSNVVRAYEKQFSSSGEFSDSFVASENMVLPFRINYEKGKLGPDRICAATGALSLFPDTNLVVVDAGTALTFGVLLSEGVFDGGLITAGVYTAIRALADRASALGEIPFEATDKLVGQGTSAALRSGFFNGYSSLVEGVFSRIERKYGRTFKLILTGGCSEVLSQGIGIPHHRDEDLVIKGLYALFLLNR
ncbi:MAG TPA: type III pantothenate kinase [Spirochaetota bacterium]